MQQVTIRSTGPMDDMRRKKLMEAINKMESTELGNLEKLLDSPKAKGYLSNNLKFQALKSFI